MTFHPRRVHGVGPKPCEFLFCGEGPGWQEDKAGIPFVGKPGEELNQRYLDGDRLPSRADVFLTNLYREYKGKDYIYTSEDLARDQQDLLHELNEVQPKLIVPMGRHATRWFMGDVDMDDVQGIPYFLDNDIIRLSDPHVRAITRCGTYTHINTTRSLLDPAWYERCVVLPIVHPASGFHNPEMSNYVVAGFTALADYLAGLTTPRKLFDDPYPETSYEEITTKAQLQSRLQGLSERTSLAIDTEGWLNRPWSVQFSTTAGTGYLIKATRPDLLDTFACILTKIRPRLIYHSALHDLSMMRVMGLPTDLSFDDTMVMAYLLQLEPQGLKPLCVRHCNMQMQSYDELTREPAERIALDYFMGLWDIEQLEYEDRCQDAFWQEIDKGRRISKTPKLPKTPLHKACGRILRAKDPRKLWSNQVEDIQVAGYNRLGFIPDATLDHVPAATAIKYACRDADGTTRVRTELDTRIESLGLRDVYNLELGTYPLIERMTRVGIKPDLNHFARLSTTLSGELEVLQGELADATGDTSFNANSGDQVAAYVFDKLGLEGVKKTSSGRFSTNDKILEALEHEHPEHAVITTIREYRELYKLKNTFVDRLPDFVRRWPYDNRVHATFRTTRVVTGRLAASDPNLLAMPKHGKFAKEFRRGWVPELGHILAEWDLSQVELRVLAHLSQDPVMLAIFRGEKRNPDGSLIDLHAALAQRIFGVAPKDQDKSKHRLPAKAVNFGLAMGMTYKGLAVELRKSGMNISEDDAQRWIDETMGLYKGMPIYQDRMIAEARRQGYIRCLSGRIRYIGGIRSVHEHVRSEAERFAFSTPVQEGAQWIMKQAEKRLYEDILIPYWRQNRWVEPLIQIHDALTLECEDDPILAQDLNKKMVACMTQAPKGFSVPIETSGDYGRNWYDLEAF